MIVLLPVEDGVHAVKGDRLVAVELDKTQLRLRVDFGTYECTYVLEGDEHSVGQAWREFLENYDQRYYLLDLTRLKRAPAPEAVATGD
jgi:hypothetical protein